MINGVENLIPDAKRAELAEKGEAMPSGAYPIRNRADLKRAVQAFGRAKDSDATKRWIKKRAKELEAEDLLPESWSEEAEHFIVDTFLAHYGILGMHWGVRKDGTKKASSRQMMEDFRSNKDSETARLRAEPSPKRTKFSESFTRESRIDAEAKAEAGKRMVAKYGEKRFSRAQKIDNAKSVLIITALASIPIAVALKKKGVG